MGWTDFGKQWIEEWGQKEAVAFSCPWDLPTVSTGSWAEQLGNHMDPVAAWLSQWLGKEPGSISHLVNFMNSSSWSRSEFCCSRYWILMLCLMDALIRFCFFFLIYIFPFPCPWGCKSISLYISLYIYLSSYVSKSSKITYLHIFSAVFAISHLCLFPKYFSLSFTFSNSLILCIAFSEISIFF